MAACSASSVEIQGRFLQSEFFLGAGCLALYSAIHHEAQTDGVAGRALACGKTLVYPRVDGDALVFVKVENLNELAPGSFGVLDRPGQNLLPVAALGLVVVPGVAFDLRGPRLGYGRGFYDRALGSCRSECLRVGFAYDSQLTDALPALDHDKTLSVLMTETRTLTWSHE